MENGKGNENEKGVSVGIDVTLKYVMVVLAIHVIHISFM